MESALDNMIDAVEDGNILTVRRLIQEGECLKDPDFPTCAFFNNWTDLEMIQLLAEAGADINAINEAGEWALRNAAEKGDMEAVSYLLSVGANVNLANRGGETALHYAVSSDNMEVARLLIDAGAEINAQDGDKWTCLWWLRSTEMVSLLLSQGADPSIPADTMIGDPSKLPEDCDRIPQEARNLLRAHRLKTCGS
jgi:uncharacterized protein